MMWWRRRAPSVAVLLLVCTSFTDVWVSGDVLDVCTTCHVNATCEEKADGRKVCNCMYGFVGNGRTRCQDKDECQVGAKNICGDHTACHNTHGSFYCTCVSGYRPSNNMTVFIPNDGTFCDDIDECQVQDVCGEGAKCKNVQGSFSCHCKVGYQVQNGSEPFQPSWGTSYCEAIDCGPPPSPRNAVMLSVEGTRYGSLVRFDCREGFFWKTGSKLMQCGAQGLWDGPSLLCQEVDCGEPPSIPHAAVSRAQGTGMGAEVQYRCREGFYNTGTGNSSHCTSRGHWSKVAMLCSEIDCGPPAALPNTDMHWGNISQLGSVVRYICKEGFYQEKGDGHSACTATRKWEEVTLVCKALCGPAPTLVHTMVLWQNGTMALHRCQEGYRRYRGSNVSWCDHSGKWQTASLHCREVKAAIRKLEVYNEHCVRWKANVYSGDQEEYKVHFVGSRVYERFFQHRGGKDFVSGASRLELCLNLLPGTNYSINVTVLSSHFSLCVSTSTSIRAPPAPEVIFRDVASPFPTLWLRRVVHTLDRISVYQVFVLPLVGTVVFDCSSPDAPHFHDCGEPCQAYVTAQISLVEVGTEVHFTIGDERHYGGYYNAPLQPGGDYYIILRAVSQWAGVRKQSCVIWAKVRGMSYIIQSTTLIAGGFVGLVAFVLFVVHSYTWYCKKT